VDVGKTRSIRFISGKTEEEKGENARNKMVPFCQVPFKNRHKKTSMK
jgi:hypothetical protein